MPRWSDESFGRRRLARYLRAAAADGDQQADDDEHENDHDDDGHGVLSWRDAACCGASSSIVGVPLVRVQSRLCSPLALFRRSE